MKSTKNTVQNRFFDRDISWLSFNERVLMEAEKEKVPLLERLKFLAIYSSNLDEFYRVRVASIMALNELNDVSSELLHQIKTIITQHQIRYGLVLTESIIPALKTKGLEFLYNSTIPSTIANEISDLFFIKIAKCLHVEPLTESTKFFPENNKIVFVIALEESDELFIVNIPSDTLSRFYKVPTAGQSYVATIDDIIRQHLPALFGSTTIRENQPVAYAFKITRDAELNLKDEVPGSLTSKLEKLLAKRDFGFATRFLYDGAMPEPILKKLIKTFKLKRATKVAGGRYHNLKDLFSFPLTEAEFSYPQQTPVAIDMGGDHSIFTLIDRRDIMVHTPYHSYDLILRFFNEAAIDMDVERIYVTLYRIAVDSAIAQALMTAARNGKKVTVLVELKARFDEANNIRWAKKMKAAGVSIVYSSTTLKVHAKVALVKRKVAGKTVNYGLLSTGNFNESTARLYTDHILLTAHKEMLKEVRGVFKILMEHSKPLTTKNKIFKHLIVAPFNIRERFSALIDREIVNVGQGKKAMITIKLNNLEEETLISKLYEASSAGVKIELIIRSICRLVPGVKDLSENIRVTRIVDRFLEHGRVFTFYNDGSEEVYCGSADWMNRNIYHRIEVCFPIYDEHVKDTLKKTIGFQLADTQQAVTIDNTLRNCPIDSTGREQVRSQNAIYELVTDSGRTDQ